MSSPGLNLLHYATELYVVTDFRKCIVAIYLMTTRRTVLAGLPYGPDPKFGTYGQVLDLKVWPDLLSLGDEMFGAQQPIESSLITTTLLNQGLLPNDPKNPGRTLPYDGRYRGDWYMTNDFFIRDASHREDGRNIENEVNIVHQSK